MSTRRWNFHFPSLLERRSYQSSSRILRLHCTSWTNWNNREVVEVTRSYIFKWRFRCRCRRRCLSSLLIGSLSNDDGNGNENVTWKYNFALLLLLRDYPNSFNLYNVDEVSGNYIDKNDVQVRKENEKFTVVCSRSPQNLKFGHFTLLFSRGRQRNVQKHIMHVQSDCFCQLNLLFCDVLVAVAVVVA